MWKTFSAHICVKSGSIYVKPRPKWSSAHSTHIIEYISPAKVRRFVWLQLSHKRINSGIKNIPTRSLITQQNYINVPLFHIAYSNTINLSSILFVLCFVFIPLCIHFCVFCTTVLVYKHTRIDHIRLLHVFNKSWRLTLAACYSSYLAVRLLVYLWSLKHNSNKTFRLNSHVYGGVYTVYGGVAYTPLHNWLCSWPSAMPIALVVFAHSRRRR